jgi:hypothetical protein
MTNRFKTGYRIGVIILAILAAICWARPSSWRSEPMC